MKSFLKRTGLALVLAGVFALGVLAFPQPVFGHSVSHGNFHVWSDRPIDPAIAGVLEDAERRLMTSELYDPSQSFRIFICNEPWRLALYTRNTAIGGAADPLISRNIYLREADIASNRLVPPPPHRALADEDVRPLSYFIAHEATHVMESRAFGRLMELRYPDWLTEGYADLVAKGGAFDIAENRRLLRAGDPRLDYARSGLYRRYHLMVATLLAKPGARIHHLFADPPEEEDVLRAFRTGS
jgi:hypothetical protein